MSDETQEVEVEDEAADVAPSADDDTTPEDEILAELNEGLPPYAEFQKQVPDGDSAEEILGATPAEEAPVEPEPAPEPDVRAEIRDLLDQGYTLPQLEVLTNSKGTPISVKVA